MEEASQAPGTKDNPTEISAVDEEQDEEEEETLEETWRRYADELTALREQSIQTNEFLNLYMSFVMGEGPPSTATVEEQGQDRHQRRCGQIRQHEMMEMMRNAELALEHERMHRALGPTASVSTRQRARPPFLTNPLCRFAESGRSRTSSNVYSDSEV